MILKLLSQLLHIISPEMPFTRQLIKKYGRKRSRGYFFSPRSRVEPTDWQRRGQCVSRPLCSYWVL